MPIPVPGTPCRCKAAARPDMMCCRQTMYCEQYPFMPDITLFAWNTHPPRSRWGDGSLWQQLPRGFWRWSDFDSISCLRSPNRVYALPIRLASEKAVERQQPPTDKGIAARSLTTSSIFLDRDSEKRLGSPARGDGNL